MSEKHILIVEDEKDISDLLRMQLNSKGHRTTVFENGEEALEFIQNSANTVDLYILDRMLPGKSGLDICHFLRMYKVTKHSPILMVTAMTRPDQIIEGLDAGADDYITKPFDLNVLLARIRALLRRSENLANKQLAPKLPEDQMQIKELVVDTAQCKVWLRDQELELTLSEYKLLCCFMREPGKVHTRKQLVESIQDGPVHVTDRTIDTHIFGLRKKLNDYSQIIETIRGIGYRVISEF